MNSTRIGSFITLFTCAFLMTCSISKNLNNLHGRYEWVSIRDVGADLRINPDNTFDYNWQYGLSSGITKGKWEIKNNQLILNSERQPTENAHTLISNIPNKIDSFEILVKNKKYGESMPLAICCLMKDTIILEAVVADEMGLCQLNRNNQAENIKIQYVGYHSPIIELSKLESPSFIIELVEESFYEYFTNHTLKIKRGKIYDPKKRATYLKNTSDL